MAFNPWRLPLRLVAPGGRRGKLSVFIFHRVLPLSDPLLPDEVSAEQFDWMMRQIGSGFNVLPLTEAICRLDAGSLPPAAASITFDDGYLDNVTIALPILQRHGLCATFFIATAFLDGGRMWNDDVIAAARCLSGPVADWSGFGLGTHSVNDEASRVACYSKVLSRLKYFSHAERARIAREIARQAGVSDDSDLMMSSAQVLELRDAGMEIGGHTHTHPILNSVDDRTAEAEMREGKERLEHLLKDKLEVFAYPNGVHGKDFSERHKDMARRVGYRGAVTTDAGYSSPGADLFDIPRFTPWDRTPMSFMARVVRNLV